MLLHMGQSPGKVLSMATGLVQSDRPASPASAAMCGGTMLLSAVQPECLTLVLGWPAVGGPLEFSMLHDCLIESEGDEVQPFPPQWQTYSAADITWVQSSFKWQLGMAGMAWGNEPVEPPDPVFQPGQNAEPDSIDAPWPPCALQQCGCGPWLLCLT